MKRIVPFNNVLEFNTDVCEITAISLEHNINIGNDVISGTFFISGDYKITDGDIKRENFNFELPFDIALGRKYDSDTLVVDIDDFRYELIQRNKLKVNIDLYIDGEEIIFDEVNDERAEENIESLEPEPVNIIKHMDLEEELNNDTQVDLDNLADTTSRDEILDNILNDSVEEIEKEEKEINIVNNNDNYNDNDNDNDNENTNDIDIFSGFNEDENYVTYHVYRVSSGDTIDSIAEKYGVTKEDIANYNDISDIKEGDKLVIPANDK